MRGKVNPIFTASKALSHQKNQNIPSTPASRRWHWYPPKVHKSIKHPLSVCSINIQFLISNLSIFLSPLVELICFIYAQRIFGCRKIRSQASCRMCHEDAFHPH